MSSASPTRHGCVYDTLSDSVTLSWSVFIVFFLYFKVWWHALECGISLAQKVGRMNEIERQAQNVPVISLLIDIQSTLESSYLQMDDIQLGFSRHAHILGVGTFGARTTTREVSLAVFIKQ